MKVRAAARATAATHLRSPASAPPVQCANEDLSQHEQLPASSDAAQMSGKRYCGCGVWVLHALAMSGKPL